MINRYIESKFSNRTPEVNFFLDDSNEEEITVFKIVTIIAIKWRWINQPHGG